MKDALVKNAGDVEQVKAAEIKEKSLRNKELADIREILSSPVGRRFIWRLMTLCKTYESIFNWENTNRTFYNSGRQDVGHFILKEVALADPDAYFKMAKEANKEEMNG